MFKEMVASATNKRFSDFRFYYNYLGNKIFMALLLSFSVGLMDGLGLAMFIPLLQMVGGEGSNVESEKLGNFEYFLNLLNYIGLELNLVTVLIIILFFFTLKGIARFFESYFAVILTTSLTKKVRVKAVQCIGNINYQYFIKVDSGKVQNTLSGEIERLTNSYRHYFAALQSIMTIIVYVTLAFLTNPQFALLVAVGGSISNLIYTQLYKKTKATSKKITKGNHVFHGLMMQQVHNFKYLRSTGQLGVFTKRLISTIDDLAKSFRKAGFYNAILLSTKEPLSILVVVSVILVQVSYFSADLGPIILSLLFFYRSLNQVISYQNSWNSFLNFSGSLENYKEFIDELEQNRLSFKDGIRLEKIDSLSIKNGFFSYGNKQFLNNINLEIAHNQTVAFVGQSGSGKTTLTNILTGLLFLDRGNMYVNGHEISSIHLDTYQSRIGYITQEPVIFNDTLYNNITFWAPKTDKNLSKFKTCLDMASLSNFYDGLPDKEDTQLGNNGIMVSGGQKQRIAIAREIFKDVDLLVMDEATSALDTGTEREIQYSFEKLKGKFTMVVVAHRLSTIKSADIIYYLSDGKITGSGNFSGLKKESAEFRRMVEMQGID
ncbi:ABC transporter ATP-binding protein [Mariniradius sediminis]|uniref:ABC transporter ATP-binding protein/permease n=1 Tax=Mariniradius sediminis TaxID=2909237 RepID=A0ABS9BQ03_9BACT|nr:ABC transporter ATP-binding protein [Mariniradius sediminis]MCF1750130.1 ABC transporter ATP-binding protein/permease [Mariniradius sediminis]